VAGVIGLAGRAIEWANRWHGNVPEDMAPVGPLTPHGSVRIQLVRSKGPSARRIRSTRARTRRGAAARRRGAL
jgi:hypothetical protein